jgi:hypothetical protein
MTPARAHPFSPVAGCWRRQCSAISLPRQIQTRSHPGLHCLSPLTTWPTHTPVNASRDASRRNAHGSGRCRSLPLHRSGLSPPTSCRSPGAPWLNPRPHPITVYASHPPLPTTAQHSLPGGALPPYRGRSFTGRNASASPDAPEPLVRIHFPPAGSQVRTRPHGFGFDAIIFGSSSRLEDYGGVPYRENAVERAWRVGVCRWHLPPRKATNSRGQLLPSAPPRPYDLSDETPNAAKTF